MPRFPLRQRADARANTGNEAATAERDDHRIHVRKVLEDLQSDGPIAGHDIHVFDRVDEPSGHVQRFMRLHDPPPVGERHRHELGA